MPVKTFGMSVLAAALLAATSASGQTQTDAAGVSTAGNHADMTGDKRNIMDKLVTPNAVDRDAWTENQPKKADGTSNADSASPPNGGFSSGAHNGNEGPMQRGNTVPPAKQQ